MKNMRLSLICLAFTAVACNKSKAPNDPLSPSLKAAFGYKVGSYWVYRDSISGETDSFYVKESNFYTMHINSQSTDMMNIELQCYKNNFSDSETWQIGLSDSSCDITFANSRDHIESLTEYFLFNYPFRLQPAGVGYDNGSVSNVFVNYTLNGQAFGNTILSSHVNTLDHASVSEDMFYISESAGIVKAVFNHPEDTVHRVLELQRYSIVK